MRSIPAMASAGIWKPDALRLFSSWPGLLRPGDHAADFRMLQDPCHRQDRQVRAKLVQDAEERQDGQRHHDDDEFRGDRLFAAVGQACG